ncbi:MAG TPA: SprT-like domain-containing protein, partial [Acidobacteriota bacterium]|nr:SprT-like domain-containing protein [Acidobacteriota bacterium]
DYDQQEYELEELFQYLNRKYWDGKLPLYRCEWSDRMISTWGSCYPHKQLIRISGLFKQRPHAELVALLCHEMIHIRYRSHGVRFRNELKRIGLLGDVQRHFPHLNTITDARRRPLRYTYECPRCQVQIRRRRRIKGYCAACYSAGMRSRFRLL